MSTSDEVEGGAMQKQLIEARLEIAQCFLNHLAIIQQKVSGGQGKYLKERFKLEHWEELLSMTPEQLVTIEGWHSSIYHFRWEEVWPATLVPPEYHGRPAHVLGPRGRFIPLNFTV